jgi:hypothetical protein
MSSAKKANVYLVFAVLGICTTWYFNINFMMENGSDIRDFISAITLNDAAMSIAFDISIVGFTFFFWSYYEAKKLGMKNWWAYPVMSCFIAIAFGAPLFMYMREKKLQESSE